MTEKYIQEGLGYLDAGARWVPVLGPGLDFIDDVKQGDALGAGMDVGLGVADFFGGYLLKAPAKAALKGLRKGEFLKAIEPWWKTGSHEWKGVDPKVKWSDGTGTWFRKMNDVPKGMPIHHWLIPQRMGWLFPKWLTNQPWNLLPLTRWSETGAPTVRAFHDAIEGKGKKIFQFDKDNWLNNYRKRYEYGTPDWAKIGIPAYGTMLVDNTVKGLTDE